MCEELESGHGSSGLARRFRGFLPVVIDLETGGFNAATDALLEVGASIIDMDDAGIVAPGEMIFQHVTPFAGAKLDRDAHQVQDAAIGLNHLRRPPGRVGQARRATRCWRPPAG